MCKTCEAEANSNLLIEVVPGFKLYEATADTEHWKAGGLAIIEDGSTNGPCMVFYDKPYPEPPCPPDIGEEGYDPDQPREDQAFFDWVDHADSFAIGFDPSRKHAHPYDERRVLDIMQCWRLVQACIRAGYRHDEDGDIWYWLFERMGRQLAGMPTTENPRSRAYIFYANSGGTVLNFEVEGAPSANVVRMNRDTSLHITLDTDGHWWKFDVGATTKEEEASRRPTPKTDDDMA